MVLYFWNCHGMYMFLFVLTRVVLFEYFYRYQQFYKYTAIVYYYLASYNYELCATCGRYTKEIKKYR